MERPIAVAVGASHRIFVLDWADFKVDGFSARGRLLRVYGRGKGTGPEQFENPADVSAAEGEVWVSDPRLDKIVGFPVGGGPAEVLHIPGGPERVSQVGPELLVMRADGESGLFERCGLGRACDKPFGVILRRQDRYSIAVDGWIAADPMVPAMFYSGVHAGLIASFTLGGRLRFARASVGGVPPPALIATRAGLVTLRNPRQIASLSVNPYLGRLYVLSELGYGGRAGQRVIDVYSETDGNYDFSFRAPRQCSQAIVESLLYCLTARRVTVWRWSLRSASAR